jgi:hypothetical protein
MRFDQAWLFRSNGSLIQNITNPLTGEMWTDAGFGPIDLLKFPELADEFGPASTVNGEKKPPAFDTSTAVPRCLTTMPLIALKHVCGSAPN